MWQHSPALVMISHICREEYSGKVEKEKRNVQEQCHSLPSTYLRTIGLKVKS